MNSPFANITTHDNEVVDETMVNEMKDTVEEVKKVVAKLKKDMYRAINEQNAKLLKKADEDVVNDLEEALHQGIDQVMISSSKKFADRRDTNKAIRLLERNMKNMYDLFVNKEEMGNEPDDAMLARKNLGFTCMS